MSRLKAGIQTFRRTEIRDAETLSYIQNQPQSVFILFLTSMEHFYLLTARIAPDINTLGGI